MHNFLYETYASGWYQVAWSDEIAAGQSVPMRYFDTELAAYRGDTGTLHISDAFCAHLGAHLGYGGQVEGDAIRCPFHGWKWDAEGRNCDIPYSRPKQMGLQIKQWPVREVDGVVLLWYGANGEEPAWEPSPFIWDESADVEFWPIHPDTAHEWRGVKFPPQVVTENSCDAAHFKYVHQASKVPDVKSYGEKGHFFRTEVMMEFGGDKPSTWATPHGPVDGLIINDAYGLGYVASQFTSFDTVYTCTATTPIDATTSDHRATVWIPKTRGDGSPLDEKLRDRWTKQQFSQHEADFPVWENMTYISRPPFARDESFPFRALREWCKQFYVAEESPA
ncbi:Rieske 2Fe-2S domain-containing protein [Nocardioides hungaricus]